MDFSERNRQDYTQALEEERKKILVFERELPLSIQLVTQAIEVCRQQQMGSEEITSEGPVLEEFIPLRPSYSSSGEEDSLHKNGNNNGSGEIGQERSDKKLDWLRSVQLWNQEPEPPHIGDVLRKPIAVNAKRVGGAFHPFEREKIVRGAAAAAPASSITENISGGGGCGAGEEKEGQSHRKVRRCWLPELHRRFLHALQQLGGSHAATPKQIRELMKVDGLTNDEVKSHLQKYRLHMRRPTTAAVQSSSPQPSQIVLVGGLWVPPPEYTTAAAAQPTADMAGAALNRVYTPVASLPLGLGSEQLQQQNKKLHRSCTGPLKSQGRCNGDDNSDDGERTNSDSSATLSSSQTTTASPPF